MEVKKQVGLWIRVSTDMQGDSPEHHEFRGRAHADLKGWEIVKTYRLEALSGKSIMGYPQTKQMLEDVKNGVISGLIFSKLARVARNTRELLEIADYFRDNESDLISLEESLDTTTPAGRFFYTNLGALAQWEREETSARVKASVPVRAKLGKRLGGNPAYGYAWNGNEFIIDEKEAAVRKLMYELYLKYRRKKTVARELNERGYRTRSGRPFTAPTIERLIKDPVAKGVRRANWKNTKSEVKPESEWVLLPAPAIISEELYDEVNAILQVPKDKPRRGKQAAHLLAGYVFCATCDKKMYVFHERSANYKCTKCTNRASANDLEEIYHQQLKTFLLTNTDVKNYQKKTDEGILQKQELLTTVSTEVEKLKRRLETLLEMRSNGEITKERFKEQYWPIEERLGQLEHQVPEIQATVDFLKIQSDHAETIFDNARTLYDRWLTLPFEEKRTIVETITEKITVGAEDIHIRLSYIPSMNSRNPVNREHVLIDI